MTMIGSRKIFRPTAATWRSAASAIGALRFDERLVHYGWLEDRDFGARVERQGGRLVRLGAALGVHLGVASGRMSDRRLGYAQIANPLHLLFKRTMSPRLFLLRVLTDLASNALKAPRSPARRRAARRQSHRARRSPSRPLQAGARGTVLKGQAGFNSRAILCKLNA